MVRQHHDSIDVNFSKLQEIVDDRDLLAAPPKAESRALLFSPLPAPPFLCDTVLTAAVSLSRAPCY